MMDKRIVLALLLALLLTGCGVTRPPEPSKGHLTTSDQEAPEKGGRDSSQKPSIPRPVTQTPFLPPPSPKEKLETYTIVVNKVPVDELLFALARDAKINIDIIGDIQGTVTLNAIDESLYKILDRITLQAPIRYELKKNYLTITADTPYLNTYAIDYLNLSRKSVSSVDLATQVGATTAAGSSSGGTAGNNNSATKVENLSENNFWNTLENNIGSILNLDIKPGTQDKDAVGRVMINREAGTITVRATQASHKEIQHFLDQVMSSARRQVLIEGTIVEVVLSDTYQAGVDWKILAKNADGFDLTQNFSGGLTASSDNVVAPNFLLTYKNPLSDIGNVLSTVKALEEFGDVKILSSPKIIALNNQTAILKVVDNRVYFTLGVDVTLNEDGQTTREKSESIVHTVPIGLVMNVTPYIGENEEVLINVRPTISRILGFVNDPNPELAAVNVISQVPEVQVREMESLLRVSSGQVAVIGGLMQDKKDSLKYEVPLLGQLPLFGRLFSYEKEEVVKTELLIFLRPTIVENASIERDLRQFKQYLPAGEMTSPSSLATQNTPPGERSQ
ncbi:MAG: pilus (MSHA type) biogenesis protein MshL [Gammaproteobacteria bacterium]|nr:pilus (MSHA type) biogenesis protein MshL [Gammaproteobacteria bacterium]